MSGQALELNGWGLRVQEHQADLDRFCQTCPGINCRHGLFFVSCFLFSLAAAMPVFGLLRIRVTDEASKCAVHAFACRDEPMPLVLDCSSDAKCRIVLVLGLRPGQAPLDICSRSNLAISNLRSGRRR